MARIIKTLSITELPKKKGAYLFGKVAIEIDELQPLAKVYNCVNMGRAPGIPEQMRVKLLTAFILSDAHSKMVQGDYPTPIRYNGISLMCASQDGGGIFVLFAWTYNNFVVFVSYDEDHYRPDHAEYALDSLTREYIGVEFLPKKFSTLVRSY